MNSADIVSKINVYLRICTDCLVKWLDNKVSEVDAWVKAGNAAEK